MIVFCRLGFRQMSWRSLFLLALVCTSFFSSAAKNRIRFNNLTANDIPGLIYVLDIYQDSEGYMWFGTYSGVIRYNGQSYKIFSPNRQNGGMSNPVVHAIAEDSQGDLWFGTEYGLNKWDRKNLLFTSYSKQGADSLSLSHVHIRDIHIDKEGFLWLGTRGGGLNKFDPENESFVHYRAGTDEGSLSSDYINTLLSQGDSLLWIGTEKGGLCRLNIYNNDIKTFFRDQNKTISTIFLDQSDNLWVGAWEDGLFLKKHGEHHFKPASVLNDSTWTPTCIQEDYLGNLWIGSFSDGVLIFNPQTGSLKRIFSNDDSDTGLVYDEIWSIMVDNSQAIWIGSFGNGVSRYDKFGNKFFFVDTQKSWTNYAMGRVNDFSEDSNGDIWFATQKGLFRHVRNTNVYQKVSCGIREGQSISNLEFDSKGNIWIGADDGMLQFNPVTSSSRYYFNETLFPGLRNYFINTVSIDSGGNVWAGIYDVGIVKIASEDIGKESNKNTDSELFVFEENNYEVIPSGIIWDIHFAQDEEVWIATNRSLCKLNRKTRIFETYYEGVAFSQIRSSGGNYLWVSTLGSGLGKFDVANREMTFFTNEATPAGDLITSFVIDQQRNIWLRTSGGISKFNPFTLDFRDYNDSDGVSGGRPVVNSGKELSNGEVLFGGMDGYIIFDPQSIQDSPYVPDVKISDVRIFNKSISLEFADSGYQRLQKPLSDIKQIEITPKDKMLTIFFNALEYSSPDYIKYAYILEGFGQRWNYVSADQPSATYTNLPAGEYLFRVKAANSDGKWNDISKDLKILVHPPIWKTNWFKVLAIVVLVLLLFLLYRIHIARIKRKNEEKNIRKDRLIVKLRNEKLDAELEIKNNELMSKTMILLHKNEKIRELKIRVNEIAEKVSKASQPKVMSVLLFIRKELENDQFWDQFEQQFNLTHNNFLDRFKAKYPVLNHKDLKHCAYIRMNLTVHEIASLLNITPRGVEGSRHRIRKKIELERHLNLTDFILNF